MESRFPEPRPSQEGRGEYRARPGEHAGALLDRIRNTPGGELFLDITDHEELCTDGSLRRMLTAAAAELGKRLTFSLAEHGRAPRTSPTHAARPARVETAPAGHVRPPQPAAAPRREPRMPIPVAVLSGRGERDTAEATAVTFSLPRLSSAGRRLAFLFAFLAGLLVTAVLVFVAPRAQVVIVPTTEPIATAVIARASVDALRADVTNGILPAEVLTTEESVERTFPVTSTVQRGERAWGTVQLTNRTGGAQRIKGASRLRAENGMVFRMETAAVIPPNGTVETSVRAEEGGAAGNLRGGRLHFVALSPDAQAVLYAEVRVPLSGGTDHPVRALADADVQRAIEQLRSEKRDALHAELRERASGEALVRDELFRVQVADARAREPLGSEVEEFHLQGTVRAELFAVRSADLLDLFARMALARTEGTKTLGAPLTVEAVHPETVDWSEGFVDLGLRVDTVAHEAFDVADLRERLKGRTADGAEEFLRALPGVRDVEVSLGPFWVRRVPSIPRNVHIDLRLPDAGE